MQGFKKSMVGLLLCTLLSPAQAMLPVVDVGAIVQLGHQLQQLRQEAAYLKMELKQLGHGQFRWANTDPLIQQLTGLSDQTSTVVADAGLLDAQFRQNYPGLPAAGNFSQAYQGIVRSTLKRLNGVSKALVASSSDFRAENARLAFLQQQAQNAEGQTQAIQASAQLASESVAQLQLLRQSVLEQSSAQIGFYATQLQKEASTQAELEKVLGAGSTALYLPKK